MKIIFATGNRDKMREIREIMEDTGIPVFSMKEAGFIGGIIENGTTFRENALIKARTVQNWLFENGEKDCIVLSDDSGICVDAMDGGPGVYSARFLGEDTSYEVKNAAIIDHVKDLPDEEKGCHYSCVIAAVFPDGTEETAEGILEGKIADHPAGDGGFGYDPIVFLPEYGKRVSEITEEEKNRISHRGKALRAMKELILKKGGNK